MITVKRWCAGGMGGGVGEWGDECLANLFLTFLMLTFSPLNTHAPQRNNLHSQSAGFGLIAGLFMVTDARQR